ncbi:MAG: ATP-binding protein [Aestuariibacter sp.]
MNSANKVIKFGTFCLFLVSLSHLFMAARAISAVKVLEEYKTLSRKSPSVGAMHGNETTIALASLDGLYVINGSRVKHINSDNTHLKTNSISDVFVTSSNVIYATTTGSGILIYELATEKASFLKADKTASNRCDGISSFQQKYYFICENALITYDSDSKITKTIKLNEIYTDVKNIAFKKIEAINETQILIGSASHGVFVYSFKTNNLRNLTDGNFFKVNSITSTTQNFIVNSSRGTFLFDYDLNLVDQVQPSKLTDVSHDETIFSFEYSQSELWISTYSNGLYSFNLKERTFVELNINRDYKNHLRDVRSIYYSVNGEILISSHLGGLVILPSFFEFLQSFEESEKYSEIWALKSINGKSFVLTDKGVYIATGGLTIPFAPSVGYSVDLDEYSGGYIVATVENGALTIDESGRVLRPSTTWAGFPDYRTTELSQIVVIDESTFFVGTYGGKERGLHYGNAETGYKKIFDTHWISKIDSIDEHKYLATTIDGYLLELDSNGSISQKIYSGERIGFICTERIKNLQFLLCTRQKGVMIFDKSLKTFVYSVEEGVTQIRDILNTGDGVVWLSTGDGLKALYLEDKTVFPFSKYDGIDSTDFSENASLKINDHEALFAGNKGLFKIDFVKAKAYMDRVRARETAVTAINVSAQSSQGDSLDAVERFHWFDDKQDKALELTHDSVIMEFDLQHNNFEDRHHVGFEVRMVGLNDNWRRLPQDRDSVTYTTLPPGDYVFQSRAVDPRSIVEQPVSTLRLTVLPPWWLSWQAYLAYAFTIVTLAYLLYLYRTRKLRKQNIYLEHIVKERTATIKDLLEQKQHFFANVSHEFRTPLTLILGPLEAIYKKVSEHEIKSQLEVVTRNARRLKHMVDQILELARLETAKSIDKQVYSVSDSVNVLVQSFESLVADKRQKIEIKNLVDAKVELIVDSFERILGNLISNAVKYCPVGATISINTAIEDDYLVMTVTDDGPGISEENKKRVFERFTRLDAGEHIQGAGIGLALVNELVVSNKGKILLESEPGQGASFTVYLPLATDQNSKIAQVNASVDFYTSIEEDATDSENATNAKTDSIQEAKKDVAANILVVEDNKDLREYIAENLSQDFTITTAKDGEEGFKKSISNIPDLIISDVLMPRMDGFELSRALREEQSTSHVPIILLTAKGDDESRMTGWRENVDDFIAKPFNVEELKLRINRLLSIREILKKRFSQEVSNNLATKNKNPISFQSKKDMEFFQKFEDIIANHYQDEDFNRTFAASELAMSERQLNRKLSALVDFNFAEYLRKYRLQRAKEALLEGQQITQVAYDIGFTSASYFTSCFKAEVGVTPKQFVEQEAATTTNASTKHDIT